MENRNQAVVGAKYRDGVYEATFTITEIRQDFSTGHRMPAEDEITVTLHYPKLEMIEDQRLADFRDESEIELIEMPVHQRD
jgi:hypothetical protein